MPENTTDSLIDESKCYKCIPEGAQLQVQTYLLDQLRNTLTAGWEDLVFPASTLNPPGPVGGGTIVATSGPTGVDLALRLGTAIGEAFWVPVQMSHSWVPQSRIYPHIHIVPQTNNVNNLEWEISVSSSDENGVFPGYAPVLQANTIPANQRYRHLIIRLPANGINMAGYYGPSTMVRMRVVLTNRTESIDIVSFDVHYLKTISPVSYNPTT